jgi:IS1 family transposase
MRQFDRVVALSVEGISKSAIARIEGLSWNTVARWLALAADAARRFNDARTRGIVLRELQLDELSTFLQGKKEQTWVYAGIEVWSRLWPATVVGSRSYKNTKRFVRKISATAQTIEYPLITTDGFKFYASAIRNVFGVACVLGQVIKEIRKNRVVRVGVKTVIGSQWRMEEALLESEDSTKLNTAFIERLNLTIRQGSAYLNRRSPCHARKRRTLEEHLELLRCQYNFRRPHSSLRFGNEIRTDSGNAGGSGIAKAQFPRDLRDSAWCSFLCRRRIGGMGLSRKRRDEEMRRVVTAGDGSTRQSLQAVLSARATFVTHWIPKS